MRRVERDIESKSFVVSEVAFSFLYEKEYEVSYSVKNKRLKQTKNLTSVCLTEVRLKYENKEFLVISSLLKYYRNNQYTTQYTIFLNKVLSHLVRGHYDAVVNYHGIFERKIKHYLPLMYENMLLNTSAFFSQFD